MKIPLALLAALTLVLASAVFAQPPTDAVAVSRPAGARSPPERTDAAGDPATAARIDNERAQAAYYRKQVEKSSGWELPAWLQTLLGGALAIAGGIVSAWWTARHGEENALREAHRTYLRQRSQLRLAASELLAVIEPITAAGRPPAYLCEELIYRRFVRPKVADRGDKYYLKYDLVNTVYRLCAFLGWLELYRTDPTFLRGPEAESSRLEACFRDIRRHLGGELDCPPSPRPCRDGFILEGDQRAIGEKMLSTSRTDYVLGYAAFCEELFREPRRCNPTDAACRTSQNWWIWNATRFFVDLGRPGHGADLSIVRLQRLAGSLRDIIDVVNRSST